jgi:ubiquinone/menaquinone biosynthesis C-methylase UbiE
VEPTRPADAPRIYDEFAERYEKHAETAFWNAHYDRPAVLSLVGDVRGRRVLDAGCGPGIYAEELVARGADVTAVDASAGMVELTRRRLGDGADVRMHDLNAPVHWLADASIDTVVSALVWHYVDNRGGALREFHRVLRPGGHAVISCQHPTCDWLYHGGSYFAVEPKTEYWSSLDVSFTSWRMPLTVVCDEFADAGFVIERLLEPQPTAASQQIDPHEYEKLTIKPGFIVFRLRRD